MSPNKRMQAARANAIWYGHSMLTRVDKVPLLDGSDAREPDASRWATHTSPFLKSGDEGLAPPAP